MKTPPALVVTYNPTVDFRKHLELFYEEFKQIIIVDNGSKPEVCDLLKQEAKDKEKTLKIIFNKKNLGIATALNQGFQWAIEHGYTEVVTFDQDSFPSAGVVAELKKAQKKHPNKQSLAVIAPIIADPLVKVEARYPCPSNISFFRLCCRYWPVSQCQ